MQWPDEAIVHFETIVTQLEGETHLVRPESDEGLLPILSLVDELSSELPNDPSVQAIVAMIEATLHPLLEEAKHFDTNSIETLQKASRELSEYLLSLQSSARDSPKSGQSDIAASFDDLPSTHSDVSADEDLPAPEANRLTGDQIVQFDKLAQQFSNELLTTESGSDEGMLPIYSILNEFQSTFESVAFLQTSIEPALATMDGLLENAQAFDEASLGLLTDFNFWLEAARSDVFQGETPSDFQASSPVSTVAETEPEPDSDPAPLESEDHLAQFTEFDVVLDLDLDLTIGPPGPPLRSTDHAR